MQLAFIVKESQSKMQNGAEKNHNQKLFKFKAISRFNGKLIMENDFAIVQMKCLLWKFFFLLQLYRFSRKILSDLCFLYVMQ
jgi:hypothetical protein